MEVIRVEHVTKIISEFSLPFPFYSSVRRHVGTVPWLSVVLRPILATAAMVAATWALQRMGLNVWLAVAGGALVYAGVLLATGALRAPDMDAIWRALRRRASEEPVVSGEGAALAE